MLMISLQKLGDRIDDNQLRDILNEVDLNKNGEIDLGEFLQVRKIIILFAFFCNALSHFTVCRRN